jgi:hypothetical protein
VLTGTLPIYYTIELRAEKYRIKKEYLQSQYDTRSREEPALVFHERIKAVKERMEYKWKEECRDYCSDNWTKRLVADVCIFRRHKRYIDHFTMQILTEHGIFNVYRRTIRKEVHARNWDCDYNLIELMVKKEENWTKFRAPCSKIMKTRLIQEKVEE